MFDIVHKYKRVIQIVIGLLVIPFAFFGMESYTRSMSGREEIASVDGMTINQREFADELRQQHERLRQMLGRGFDAAAFDTPEARRTLLDSLIAQRLVGATALGANLAVTQETLDEVIVNIPAFQRDGRFDRETAKALLRAQGISEEQFAARLRYDLTVSQLARAVAEAAIMPRSVAERLAALEAQRREVQEALIAAQPFASQVKLDEARLKAHYDAQLADFRTPERVRAEYVVLSAEELGRGEPVSEQELKVAYDSRAGQYQVGEQRRASHILIQRAPDAQQKAEELLAQLKKDPGRFAELAKKHSQDPGSADKGGDLGVFGRGMMAKGFEDAAFRLKPSETSGLVESEFGLHIIRLTGLQPGKVRPLDEVRKELADELQRQKGARRFAEAAEAFSNLAYEQPDSLKPAAERFKLAVQATGWIARNGADLPAALAHPRMQSALFGADAVKQRRNTDAIEVAPGTLVAARVLEHQPAAQRKLEEVRTEIEQMLRRREAAALAHQEGAAKLEQLRRGGDAGLKWSAARTVRRGEPHGLSPEALRRVVSEPATKLPAYVGLPAPEDGGYLVYRIAKVIEPGPPNEPQAAAALARVGRIAGAAQYEAYVASLRARADIKVNTAGLEKK